jgi:hypothetical protein
MCCMLDNQGIKMHTQRSTGVCESMLRAVEANSDVKKCNMLKNASDRLEANLENTCHNRCQLECARAVLGNDKQLVTALNKLVI